MPLTRKITVHVPDAKRHFFEATYTDGSKEAIYRDDTLEATDHWFFNGRAAARFYTLDVRDFIASRMKKGYVFSPREPDRATMLFRLEHVSSETRPIKKIFEFELRWRDRIRHKWGFDVDTSDVTITLTEDRDTAWIPDNTAHTFNYPIIEEVK